MATPFTIQKNVPIPSIVRDPSSVSRKYDYAAMQVGDFFFVPGKDKNTLSSHASAAGKRLGRRFLTRLIYALELEDGSFTPYADVENTVAVTDDTEDAVQGIGVWRLADGASELTAEADEGADDEADDEEEF